MNRLILRYSRDETDYVSFLEAEVVTPDFSGRGGYWLQGPDLSEFGASFNSYPLADPAPVLELGGQPAPFVRIAVYPIGSAGHLLADVEIADQFDRHRRVRTTFPTYYPQVESFARALVQMAEGYSEEAVLNGE